MERPEGQAETGLAWQQWRGPAVELAVGIVLSVVLALMVALAGREMTGPAEGSIRTPIYPLVDELPPRDPDPRDPLVRCTVFVTHTHCVREPS